MNSGKKQLFFLGLWLVCGLLQAAPLESGLLWRVQAGDGARGWLFGTIHVEDPRVLELPESVLRAFDASSTFVGEMELDTDTLIRMAGRMRLPEGQSLDRLLGNELYTRTEQAMEGRLPGPSDLVTLQPWAALMLLNTPPGKTGVVLDLALYQRASQNGKQCLGLESLEEQLSVFADLSLDEQRWLLRDTLEHLDEFPALFAELIAMYLARDLTGIREFSEHTLARGDPALWEKLNQRLLVDRNRRMAERLRPILDRGDAFIAIGALHLAGEHGLLELLSGAGYTLERRY